MGVHTDKEPTGGEFAVGQTQPLHFPTQAVQPVRAHCGQQTGRRRAHLKPGGGSDCSAAAAQQPEIPALYIALAGVAPPAPSFQGAVVECLQCKGQPDGRSRILLGHGRNLETGVQQTGRQPFAWERGDCGRTHKPGQRFASPCCLPGLGNPAKRGAEFESPCGQPVVEGLQGGWQRAALAQGSQIQLWQRGRCRAHMPCQMGGALEGCCWVGWLPFLGRVFNKAAQIEGQVAVCGGKIGLHRPGLAQVQGERFWQQTLGQEQGVAQAELGAAQRQGNLAGTG